MLEIVKALIEHVLGWPVAALILGLIFREQLSSLLGRVNSFKGPGFDISAPHPPASVQADANTVPSTELLNGEVGAAAETLDIATAATPALATALLAEKREAVLKFGVDNAIVFESVGTIESQLRDLGFQLDSAETAKMLIRHLASTQLSLRCERTHRIIFGSQVLALQTVNTGRQSESALRAIFENARAKEPQFYGSYSFEQWIGFLIKETTIKKVEEEYVITVYGQNYLEYIGVFATTPKLH